MCICFRIVLILQKKMMMWLKWRIDQNPSCSKKRDLPDEVMEKVMSLLTSMEDKRCEETTKD